jgi:hypothetical protein
LLVDRVRKATVLTASPTPFFGLKADPIVTVAVDDSAKKMSVATEWKDLGKFEDFLVQRLTGE